MRRFSGDIDGGRHGMWRMAWALLFCLVITPLQAAEPERGRAILLQVTGVIGPASSDYVTRNLRRAHGGAELVILQMDTPGGLDISMRAMIQDIIASPVPVIVYVAPAGARAASAGTYLIYASHLAAMAPGTNLGAATPVQIATPMSPGAEDKKPPSGQSERDDPMSRKIVTDAVAYIQSLAKLRGRNAEWAEKAVREGASLPAEEAVRLRVVELLASDVDDLLSRINGRKVTLVTGEHVLRTAGIEVEKVEPDWRSRLLAVITDPNVAYVLMLIGIYGLIYELASPGMVLPGVVGAISLILALFAFQVLPINYAGLGLIVIGIAFMVGEALLPSFGALGIGGLIAFVIGSVMLLETEMPGYGISYAVIAALAIASAIFFVFVIGMALKARRRPVVSGREQMTGSEGVVLEDFEHQGHIRIHGELWMAVAARPLRKGQRVRVTRVDGLNLHVEPFD